MVKNSFTSLVMTLLLLVVFIGFSIFYLYYYNSKEKTLPKESQEQQASTDSKESQEVVFVIIIIEEDYTESSEDEYPEDYEDDFFMDYVRYPFRDIDLNVRSINGFETEAPSLNWSLGKVDYIDQDTNGEILWVWVQIHLYYPTPMPSPLEPTQFILQCRLSEDLGAHPISEGDFVLLEYHRRANEENFLNRTFTIIKIQNN